MNIFHGGFFKQVIMTCAGDKSSARFHNVNGPLCYLSYIIRSTLNQDKVGINATIENDPVPEFPLQFPDVHPPASGLYGMKAVQSRFNQGRNQLPEAPATMEHHLQTVMVTQAGQPP